MSFVSGPLSHFISFFRRPSEIIFSFSICGHAAQMINGRPLIFYRYDLSTIGSASSLLRWNAFVPGNTEFWTVVNYCLDRWNFLLKGLKVHDTIWKRPKILVTQSSWVFQLRKSFQSKPWITWCDCNFMGQTWNPACIRILTISERKWLKRVT